MKRCVERIGITLKNIISYSNQQRKKREKEKEKYEYLAAIRGLRQEGNEMKVNSIEI
jgi:hypothetical protein